ncbi:cell division protein PerM [Corynebacterium vitaeruminis]|uniref:Uncharacterized protein n=1 Tax=Corynebacterium vitaeruminis DSM 20294 TaxID=1224164 RepID=W5Y050_9CORY|nr:DUF6350 family protein [Corynebacterium vitaeruminis]AHI22275.1 hypothetical protein B843_04430 [Corynebacterium vitaeruminis DSM 20294]
MSKKSSPQQHAGPSRRPAARRYPRRIDGATGPLSVDRPGGGNRRFGRKKAAPEVTFVEPTFLSRVRAFLPVTALPNLICVITAIVVALVALIATSSTMVAFPSFVAQFWLVVNLGPVVGRGETISLLPLAPAMLLAWAVSRRVYRTVKDRVSIADLAVLALCVLGIPLLLTLTASAMLLDASAVFDVEAPPLGTAIARTLLLHGLALGWGMGRRLWRALCRRFRLPDWLVDSSLDAVRALKYVAIGAGVVYLVALVVHYSELGTVYGEYGSAAGKIAVTLVSLLYLPNVVVSTAALTFGSEVALGQGSVSLFGANLVPLPPLPALAAVPQNAHAWAMVVLVVPTLGVLASIVRNVPTVKVAAVGGLFASLYTLIIVFLSAGTLGVYGYVGPSAWLSASLALAWIGGISVIAAVVALLMQRGIEKSVVEIEEEQVLIEDETEEEEAEDSEAVEDTDTAQEAEEAEEAEELVDPEDESDTVEEIKEEEVPEEPEAEQEAASEETEEPALPDEETEPEAVDKQEKGDEG